MKLNSSKFQPQKSLRLTALEAQTQQDYNTNKALTIQRTKDVIAIGLKDLFETNTDKSDSD